MNESGAKLLVMLAALISLFMVGRWISARAESSAHDPTLIQHEAPPAHPLFFRAMRIPDPNAPIHPEMDFGPVVLKKLYFNAFDAVSGPTDPLRFADDMTVEVYFKQTGSLYENTYTVATPAGLDQLLRDKELGHPVQPGSFYREPIRSEVDPRDTSWNVWWTIPSYGNRRRCSDVERFMG